MTEEKPKRIFAVWLDAKEVDLLNEIYENDRLYYNDLSLESIIAKIDAAKMTQGIQ